MNKRIEINTNILMGKPVIKGTRIPVYIILNFLAHDYNFERIIKAYPVLKKQDIRAALEYSEKRLKGEEIFPLTFKQAIG